MKRRSTLGALAGAAALAAALAASGAAYAQQTTLRVFSGGANQRPDLMRKLFDQYQAKNPGVKIDIETGSAST
jgi:multiple sugar transport system substrate-binding protein